MRVRFLQSVAAESWHHDCGDVIETDDGRAAKQWVKGGVAEVVGDEVPIGRALPEGVCPSCGAARAELQRWCATCGLRGA